MKVRYGNISDAMMLSELGAKTFYDTFAKDNTPENINLYMKKSFSTEIQFAELSDPNIVFLIAELESEPVGFAKLKLNSKSESIKGTKPMEIERIYSAQEHIGKGVGKELMQTAISEAKQRGCNSIWLGVWEKNPLAIHFYKKWGFEEVGTHIFMLGDDSQRDFIMELRLSSPYKFLDFYGIDDQNIFFGREREANILVADVVVNRLVVLFARTGTGKTSLINAGVRPLLEKRGYSTFYIRVEQDPTKAARSVLGLEDDNRTDSLSAQLCSIVESLNKPIVLFFDQFEEFFIQISDKKTRREFISDISEVYRNVESGVHLVFSMREEYFHEMDEFRSDIPSIFHKNSNLRLLPLDENQASDAIIKPAAVRKVVFDEDLANAIIDDLKKDKEGIRAPSLQIICDTLWLREDQKDRHITLKDYEDLGRGQNILDQRLAQDIERVLKNDPELITLMQKLIPELVTEDETKRPRLVKDLADKSQISKDSLQKSISLLKDIQVIKETTIAGEEAIEWASDYLAERTELIQDIVKSIELDLDGILKELRQEKTDSSEWRLTREDFEEFTLNKTTVMKLKPDEIEMLFDKALFYRSHMKLWLERVSGSTAPDLGILSNKIHNKDLKIELREGVLRLLLELGSSQALHLLEEALDEPELSKKAIETIIEFPGERAFQLLVRLLERDDLWESVVFTLGETERERAIQLLQPLLGIDTKFFEALAALESLAKSKKQIGDKALESLETATPKLAALIQQKELNEKFFYALSALERLAKTSAQIKSEAEKRLDLLKQEKNFPQAGNLTALEQRIESSSQIRSEAEKTLEIAIPKAILPQQEEELSKALSVLERLTQYTNSSIGGEAEKILEAAIPILEGKLSTESTRDSARSELERLSKSRDPIGSMAQTALQKIASIPTTTSEAVERKPRNRAETFPATREKESTTRKVAKPERELNRRFQMARERLANTASFPTSNLDDLMPFISNGTAIPVISNSFRMEQIFQNEQGLSQQFSERSELDKNEFSIQEQLTREWAYEIGYPLADVNNLPHVAQFYQVEQKDSVLAKTKYLRFLSDSLLHITADDISYQDVVESYQKREVLFSKLVRELDYPRFPQGIEDPLGSLARLPLNTYITTSYYNFMEQALEKEGKQPRTQVVFSSGKKYARPEHQIDPDFVPSVASPTVYHLYGLEDYPQTLVLSEDDYLNFLISANEDTGLLNPLIPSGLRVRLAESRLLLLGYRVNDWDFQVLLRLALMDRRKEYSSRGFLTQLISSPQMKSEEKLKAFLSRYFDKRQFDIEWTSAEMFIQRLWDKWDAYRKGL